ncbi:MAG: hypothetical protein DJ555_01040 [Desulfurococcaceae archaeon]|nr:MAG: hypothetical protein DJ555_01040 [Desulfurococcaceae archaeon]
MYREYYLLLSQEHPELSFTEAMMVLRSVDSDITISYSEPGLVIFRARQDVEELVLKFSFIKELGLVLRKANLRMGSTQIYREILIAANEFLNKCCRKIELRIYNLGRKRAEIDYGLIIKRIREETCLSHSNESIDDLVGLSCTITIILGSILVIAIPIARRAGKGRGDRTGYMKDTDILFLANVAVNLGTDRRIIYDPFGGYGKILEKICDYDGSLMIIGGDIDLKKAIHMKQKLGALNKPCLSDVIVADALNPPLRPGCIDLIVSDLPYGRRSRSVGEDYLEIPVRFLQNIARILPERSALLISISLEQLRRVRDLLQGWEKYKIVSISSQHIHGGLTRIYLLLLTNS